MRGLAPEIAQILTGAALAIAVLLLVGRASGLIRAYAAQAVVVAATVGWQGIVRSDPALLAIAATGLLAKGVALPAGLRAMAARSGPPAIEPAGRRTLLLCPGVAVVGVAMLVTHGAAGDAAPARQDLTIAVAIALLGLLTMIARRTAPAQMIGFLAIENGLALATLGVPGPPFVFDLCLGGLVSLAGAMTGWVCLQPVGASDAFTDRPGRTPA